jgi:GrpB-like predicted nucleotidyltransferase (UPF0157 family)
MAAQLLPKKQRGFARRLTIRRDDRARRKHFDDGIAAKPIIDIAVSVEKPADGERCVAPLENIGYEYRGEHGIAGRFYFVKGEPRTHHLHMSKRGSDFGEVFVFRDYLRAHPAVARRI